MKYSSVHPNNTDHLLIDHQELFTISITLFGKVKVEPNQSSNLKNSILLANAYKSDHLKNKLNHLKNKPDHLKNKSNHLKTPTNKFLGELV